MMGHEFEVILSNDGNPVRQSLPVFRVDRADKSHSLIKSS